MRIVLAVVLVVALVGVAGWALQRRLIYLPDSSAPPSAATVLPGAEDVVLTTADGLELDAWFVPGRAPDGPGAGFTVLLAPGNGGNRLGRVDTAADLAAAGFSTLLFDYRGYGGNPGSPTEEGLAADARAALGYLRSRDDVDPTRLLYFGESLAAPWSPRSPSTTLPPRCCCARRSPISPPWPGTTIRSSPPRH